MKERNMKGGTVCVVGWRECGLIWSRSSGQAPLKMRCYDWDLYLVWKIKGGTGLGWVQNVQRSRGSRKPASTWRVVRAAQGRNEVNVSVKKTERGGWNSQHPASPAQKCNFILKATVNPRLKLLNIFLMTEKLIPVPKVKPLRIFQYFIVINL